MDQLMQDLICPITLELMEDPIAVPCCGRNFSRAALMACESHSCPMCNASLADFDIVNATRNVNIAGMVDTVKEQEAKKAHEEQKLLVAQQWKCFVTPLVAQVDARQETKQLKIAELKLLLVNARFATKPSHFIIVVDRSGSMSGKPWKQCQSALTHILSLTYNNPLVKSHIICYQSFAEIVNTENRTLDEISTIIRNLSSGGGTDFGNAFLKIGELLATLNANDIGAVNIAFLTDGQATGNNQHTPLIDQFRTILTTQANEWKTVPLTVHAVGFSSSCDKVLLEGIRQCGNQEGVFQYAEPADDDDTLCHKLTSLFVLTNVACVAPITLKMVGGVFDNCTNALRLQYPIDVKHNGVCTLWVHIDGEDEKNPASLIINSEFDQNVNVICEVINNVVFDPRKFGNWLRTRIDALASELLTVVQAIDLNPNTRELHLCLLLKRIQRCMLSTQSQELLSRLQFLQQQITDLLAGFQINIGKLADVRFASQFHNLPSKPQAQVKIHAIPELFLDASVADLQLQQEEKEIIENKLHPFLYQLQQEKHRNWIQNDVFLGREDLFRNGHSLQTDLHSEGNTGFRNVTLSDLQYQDDDGNTVLHLAAFLGETRIVESLFAQFPNYNCINLENKLKETALTLAIKRKGFFKTAEVLRSHGAKIPKHRMKGLKKFAEQHGYGVTARFLSRPGLVQQNDEQKMQICDDIDETMSNDLIMYSYQHAEKVDVQKFLEVACAKRMIELLRDLFAKHKPFPSLTLLMDFCIPKKPDDPQTPTYIEMTEMFLDCNPDLVYQYDEKDLETPLFKACERGSLPHVELFFKRNGKKTIETANVLSNTPLWIACSKRHPCIIECLLSNGANPNHVNNKQNPPLYGVCERGPLKVVQLLLSFGATVDFVNANGDTSVLLASRNGQAEILDLFLDNVTQEFANHVAQIDGFNALFAAVEQNHPQCIDVLLKHGIDLEQKTAFNNPILAGATPLHLASFYGRTKAAQKLIESKANIDSRDKNQATPLHTAVVQGHLAIVALLQSAGANVHTRDMFGNTPLSYSKSKPELYKILIDPLLAPIMRLAKTKLHAQEELAAFHVLQTFSGIKNFIQPQEILDVRDYDASTPLMQAIIYSQFNLVHTLLDLGCEANLVNAYGISSNLFAMWIKNPRIYQVLKHKMFTEHDLQQFERLKLAAEESPSNRNVLYLGVPPRDNRSQGNHTGLFARMQNYIQCARKMQDNEKSTHLEHPKQITCTSFALENFANDKFVDLSKSSNSTLIWNAKVHIVNLVASGKSTTFSVSELLCLLMFTNNSFVPNLLNDWLLKSANNGEQCLQADFQSLLVGGLLKLPDYEGEAFFSVNTTVDRANFAIGENIEFPCWLSATTLFAVALENVADFTTKKKQGTVFLVKCKHAKFLASYSQSMYEAEVIFKPRSKFVVAKWYHGDIIALGQANIREHTFGVKDCDVDSLRNSNKSLIIELVEIE